MGGGVFWGGLSSLGFGTADFVARFTSRGVGEARALLGMLVVGTVVLSVYLWVSGAAISIDAATAGFLVVGGIANMFGLFYLYRGLALGPVSVAAPVVSAHPALVIIVLALIGIMPSFGQWVGIALTIGGVVALSRVTGADNDSHGLSATHIRRTIRISLASAVALAATLLAAQEATAVAGALVTTWGLRVTALAALLTGLVVRRRRMGIPIKWWPAITLQGLLDTGGVVALMAGSVGTDRAIVAAVSGTFAAVTVILAWLFLGERIGWRQWSSIGAIVAGVAMLAIH